MNLRLRLGLLLLLTTVGLIPARCADLTLGAKIRGTIAQPGDQAVYTFQGTAGQRLFYDALDLNTANLAMRLIGPSGTTFFTQLHYQDRLPFTLVETGIHRLVIDGNSFATGNFGFRLLDLTTATVLPIGPQVSGQLSERSEAMLYRFTGRVGQKLAIKRLASSSTEAAWHLFSPADQQLAVAGISSDLGNPLLPMDGMYTLIVAGSSANPGTLDYQFLVADLSEARGTPAGFGDLRSGTLTATQTNQFTLAGYAGQWFALDSQDRNTSVVIDLRAPPGTGTPILTLNAGQDSVPYVLPLSGAYTVSVRGTGAYRFRWLDLSSAPALPLNTDRTVPLAVPFQTDVYRLPATAGQRYYYDAIDADQDAVTVRLWDPTGTRLLVSQNSDFDFGPLLAGLNGTYYVMVESGLATATDYRFRFLDYSALPVLPLNTLVTTPLASGKISSSYRFDGVAGQRYFFDGRGTNTQLLMYLFGPNNLEVTEANLQRNMEVDLTSTGPYFFLLYGDNPSPVTASFRVGMPTIKSNTLALGATIVGRIAEPGEEHVFTFAGAPGQRLFYDTWLGENLTLRLVGPSGADVISARNAAVDFGPFTLSEAGNYSLILDGNDEAVPSYVFRLLDAAVAPAKALPIGTPVGGDLAPVPAAWLDVIGSYVNKSLRAYTNQDDWRASQTIAGTRKDTTLNFNDTSWGRRADVGLTGGTDADWAAYSVQWDGTITVPVEGTRLFTRSDDGSRMWIDLNRDGRFDATGAEFVNNNWGVGQGVTTGPASVGLAVGTYRIRIQYEEDSGGNNLILLTDNGLSINPGTRAEIYRFEAAPGDRFYLAPLPMDNGGRWASGGTWFVFGPNNEQITAAGFRGALDFTATRAGTHLLMLNANSSDPVPFHFQVVTPATVTLPLVTGAVTRNSLTGPGDVHLLTFNGVTGQRFYLDALNPSSPLRYRLINPGGGYLERVAYQDLGPFTLRETGVYTLQVFGSGSTTGEYALRLVDLDSIQARRLVLGNTYGLTPVPASALKVTGSYVNTSLRGYAPQDDWRLSQPIAGTRADAQINFSQTGWGQRAAVGLSAGPDDDWNNFSVQWDGSITLPKSGMRLYSQSDDGTRLWIDLNGDGVFGTAAPELVNNGWGVGHGLTLGAALPVSSPGSYRLRLQYEEGSGGNEMFLLWDQAELLSPASRAELFHFTGQAGQRLFFDSLRGLGGAGWSLYGPNNEAVPGGNQNIVSDFEITLAATGEYVLVLDGSTTNDVPYSFRVSATETPVRAIVPGESVTGTLAGAGDQHVFTFQGLAGQRLFYDAVTSFTTAIRARLESPSGTLVLAGGHLHYQDAGPFTLPESGLYRLVVDGDGDTVGAYAFRLVDVAAVPAFDIGPVVGGSLNPRAAANLYRFNGTAGQRLSFKRLSASGNDATWELFSPVNESLLFRSLTGDLGEALLPLTGVYVLAVKGPIAAGDPFTYQILAADLTQNPGGEPVGLADLRSGTLRAGDTNRFTFTAPAGRWVYFDSQDATSGNLTVELRDPSGASVPGTPVNAASDAGPFVLPAGGTYSVLVRGGNATITGSYRFRWLDLAAAPMLTLGRDTAAELNPGYQTDVYQFMGVAGQRLRYDGLQNDSDGTTVSLFTPNGRITYLNGGANNDVELFTLAESGPHHLLLRANRVAAANYAFRLVDLAAQPPLPLNTTVDVTLTPGLGTQMYRLEGIVGQRFFFQGLGTNRNANYYLYGPQNQYIAGGNVINNFEATLPVSGVSALVVIGSGDAPVLCSFRVVPQTPSETPLVPGANVSGRLSQPGQQNTYTFTGRPGQRVFFDGLDIGNDPIFARLDDPSGTQIFTRSTRDDIGPFKLAESGQYRLLVYASGDAVGDYHFRLLDADLAPSEAIVFGRTYGGELVPVPAAFLQLTSSYVNKSLSTYINQDDWKVTQTIAGTRPDKQIDFPAAAAWGQRSSVGLTGGTDANWENFSAQWDGSITIPVAGTRLFLRSDDSSRMWIDLNNDGKFDADGPEFLNNSWGRNQSATLSPAGTALPAGTYRFRVQYEERSSDNVMQLLWDNALSLAPGTGARIYRVEGKAGQKLFVDGFGPDTRGALYLYGPDNDTPGSAAVNGAGVAGNFERVLEAGGSYLLVLTGNSPEAALPFAFRVNAIDLAPRPLTLGSVVTSQLAQAGEEHRYVFTGAPGQQLYYDGQGSDASLFARLVQPDGSVQLTVGAGNDQGIFQLKQAGQYQLVVYGTGDNTGNYSFQLLDVAAQPTLPLGSVFGGTLSPGRAAVIYRLPASPGERFYFDGLGTNNGAGWRLMAPTTEVVGDANVTGDFEPASLTRAGVYALVIYGNVDAPVPYSVRVLVPADVGTVRNLPPLISAIPALSGPVGQVIGPINFTVQDTETAVANLKVTAVSSEPRLLPGERISLGGVGANRTVTLTPLANQTGNTIVTLTVTDADGAAASISFPVTITGGNRLPTLSAITDQNAAEGATVGPIALTVDDAETAPAALMLDGQSSNQELLRNGAIVFGGRGQTRTLTLFPTAGRTGQATVTVTLADLDGGRTTRNFLLTVTTTPAFIRVQPTGLTVRAGATTRFEVSAGGTAPLAYQWRFNGTNIAGAIAPALNLNSITPAAAGEYSVRVANAGGAVTSQVARLRVLVPPVITLQPAPATVAPGAAVTFRVQVAGIGPFRYQWQLNGVNIPGQTAATLSLPSVQTSEAGVYRVVVASLDGALVSEPARLTVLADALAFSNDFAGRVKLTSPAGSGRGFNTGFTRELNEPVHAGRVGGASAWIAWVAPGDGVAVFTTRGSSFDTLLGVYTGGTLASLVRVAADDDSGGFATSATRFNVTRGAEYQIAIDGLKRASGEIILRWEFTATTTLPPVILSPPASQVVLVGATAAFSVTAINPPGAPGALRYQWFLNGRSLTGQTLATLTVSNAQVEDVGNYTVEVANAAASVTSTAAALQLSSADTDPRNAGVGSEDKFAVLTTLDLPGGLIPPAGPQPAAVPRGPGSRTGAAVARGYTSTQVFNTSGSGTEEGEPNHCGVIGGASQWFAYQPEANGTLTISTDGSDFDTVLAIYTGPGDSFETLTQIACDNDSGADGKDSLVRFAATAGTTYYVAVDGVNGATGNVRLSYKLDGPARLAPLALVDGEFRLRLNGLPGQGYTIEFSTGLPVWQPFIGVSAPTGMVEFGDPDAANSPARFYRATTTP